MIFIGFQLSAVNTCVALGYQCKQCTYPDPYTYYLVREGGRKGR
jgi:hypothetical protein